MNKALIIGGSNGIGMAIAVELSKRCSLVNIVDKEENADLSQYSNIKTKVVDLTANDFGFLTQYDDIDTLVITAGFGRLAPFENIMEFEIDSSFQVNAVSAMKVLHHFFNRMKQQQPFHCAVMGSIAGLVSSPLFVVYSATKAAVCRGVEGMNIELEMAGTPNRITNVSPGSIKGTRFNGGSNDLSATQGLALQIIEKMEARETLFIPQYEEVFRGVLQRYHDDAHQFGVDSFQYKLQSGRMGAPRMPRVGYLSGTFDLFHIGHLNILRRARQHCDYLVVGVHPDASHKGKQTFVPFEERLDIVGNIKFVNRVITAEREDVDVWKKGIVHYTHLFVGSDYKGSERFRRYEEFFSDKGVEIVYFPYTKGTSSTQLREALSSISQK